MKLHAAHKTHGTLANGRVVYRPACSSGQNSHGMVAQHTSDVNCKKCLAMVAQSSPLLRAS